MQNMLLVGSSKKYEPIGREWNWNKVKYTVSGVGGRKFARHPSNMGTVMSFNDGTERSILVLDAQYRKVSGYAYYTKGNVNLNDLLPNNMKLNFCPKFSYVFSSSQSLPFTGMSDTDINASYSIICNQDTRSSKDNTDSLTSEYLNSGTDKAEAANYCRNEVLVNGTGCDLPNINTLIRIYAEMIQLDSMDPTIIDNHDLALSSWFNNGYCWSSSWCRVSVSIYGNVYYALSFGYTGYCSNYSYQDGRTSGVLPVLEMQ